MIRSDDFDNLDPSPSAALRVPAPPAYTEPDWGKAGPTSDITQDGRPDSQDAQDLPQTEMNAEQSHTGDTIAENGSGIWANAWSQLQKHQSEFEKRTTQLEILRQRLERHLGSRAEQPPVCGPRGDVLSRASSSTRTSEFLDHSGNQHTAASDDHALLSPRSDRGIIKQYSASSELISAGRGPGDRIALDYQDSIDTLVQERYVIEQRMVELQRQVTKRDFTQPDTTRPGAYYSLRRIFDWRLGVASLLGLIAAGLLIVSTRFVYQVGVVVEIDPTVVLDNELDHYQTQLTGLLPAGFGAIDNDVHLASGGVVVGHEDARTLDVRALALDPREGEKDLRLLLKEHVAHLRVEREQARSAVENKVHELDRTIDNAHAKLATIVRQRADQRLSLGIENPKEESARLTVQLQAAHEGFEELQNQLGEAHHLLATLQNTTVPDFPEVDETTRSRAEDQDNYLKTDLEGLRVRLNQLRSHLLEVFAGSDDVILPYAAAAERLLTFIETARVSTNEPKLESSFEILSTLADKLSRLTVTFREHWHRRGRDLQKTIVDPRRKDCLESQREFEKLAKEFGFDTNEVLKDLQVEYEALARAVAGAAQEFQVRNELVRHMKDLVEQQHAFSDFARRVLPTSDLRLNDILHSVVGLTRRVQDRRAAIDADLSMTIRARLVGDLAARTERQKKEVSRLNGERDHSFARVIELQAQRESLVPYLEEHGATTTVIRHGLQEIDGLRANIDELVSERADLQEQMTRLGVTAAPLRIHSSHASGWPDNGFERLSTVGFGTLTVTASAYLLLWLVGKLRVWFLRRSGLHPSDRPGCQNGIQIPSRATNLSH